MKKSLIAAAVAGLFVAPAAMADVTISGAINMGIALIDSDDGKAAPGGGAVVAGSGQAKTSLATNYSNMNIMSVDDIGNGNKIILNAQLNLGALSNTGDISNRNSYLGIEGGWGSFKMGTNENVYERWAYESDPMDGAAGIAGNIQMLGQNGYNGSGWFDVGNGETTSDGGSFWRRTSHTIWYNSPVIAKSITFEIDRTLNAFKTNTVDPVVTSLGAQFKPEGGKFFVNVGYETHDEGNVTLNGIGALGAMDALGTSIGGGITLGPFLITARYEMLEWEQSTGAAPIKLERTHTWVGLKWMLASGYFGAEIGMADEAEITNAVVTTTDSDAMMIGVGYFHNLSKQSQLQVMGTQIDNGANANYGVGAGTGSSGGIGSDHFAVTVGIKHTF